MHCFDVVRALFAKLAMASEYQASDLQMSAQGRVTKRRLEFYLSYSTALG